MLKERGENEVEDNVSLVGVHAIPQTLKLLLFV